MPNVTLSGFALDVVQSRIISPFQGYKSRKDEIIIEKRQYFQIKP